VSYQHRTNSNDNIFDIELSVLNALKHIDYIDFAILFGSYAKDASNHMSDVDIGIYTARDVSLLELGQLSAIVESTVNRNVDIIVMNDLYRERPLFVYDVISNGKVIFSRKRDILTEYRRRAYLYYLDVRYLIDDVNKRFKERLLTNKFGERTYA
jgi:predicted nucleotidyltransferase